MKGDGSIGSIKHLSGLCWVGPISFLSFFIGTFFNLFMPHLSGPLWKTNRYRADKIRASGIILSLFVQVRYAVAKFHGQ